jgi:antitoxin component YwqK of YwqJK toxin-antitoxin module
LGLTLNQVAKFDENGEKLLYYPQKALENHAVMPGQAVPVARKGMFTLHESAFDISDWATDAAVGHALCVMGNGKVSGKQSPSAGEKAKSVGIVIATGTRTEAVQGSQLSGNYAVCAIDC